MCTVVFFFFFFTVDGDKWQDVGTDTKPRTLQSFLAAWKHQGFLTSPRYLLLLSAGLDKCVPRCGRWPSPLIPAATFALLLWFLPAAHVGMIRSNLGDMALLRHGDCFDVCLLSPAIRQLVSKFVFSDILAEGKQQQQKRRPGTLQMLKRWMERHSESL